eukprot:scaffold52967_cov74-Phaeocystis_antarctica.AAC.1
MRLPVGTQFRAATIACWLQSTSTSITQGDDALTPATLTLRNNTSTSGHHSVRDAFVKQRGNTSGTSSSKCAQLSARQGRIVWWITPIDFAGSACSYPRRLISLRKLLILQWSV